MEDNESNTTGAEPIPAVAGGAPYLDSPGSSACKKRDFESAFPEPSSHGDVKRARSHPPFRATSLEYEDTGDTPNVDNGLPNGGDSMALTSDSSEARPAEPEFPLDPVLVHQTLATGISDDVAAASKASDKKQADIIEPIGPAPAQESLATAPDDGNATTVAGESYVMKQTASTVPLEAAPKEEASTVESGTQATSATLACDELKHVLERSHIEILKHVKIITQNTDDVAIDHHTTCILTLVAELFEHVDVIASNVTALIRSSILSSEDASFPASPLKSGSDQASSQCTHISLSKPIPFPDDADSGGLFVSSVESATFEPAAARTSSSNEYQDTSTQTEPMENGTTNHTLGSPTLNRNNANDAELWRNELESIRRPRPLVTGSYTKVNVPLRETVEKVGSGQVKGSHNVSVESNRPSGYPLRSKVGTKQIISHNSCDIIDLSDTDDGDEKVRTRASRLVGGSDFSFDEDDPFGGNIQEGIQGRGGQPRHGDYSNEKNNTIHGPLDYEAREVGEYNQEEVARHRNSSVWSVERCNSTDYGDDDYDGRHPLDHGDVMDIAGREYLSQQNNPMTRHGNIHIEREEERFPQYHRDKSPEKEGHRSARNYSPRYSRDISPVQIRREDAQLHLVEATAQSNTPNPKKHRYIRDEPENFTFYGYSPNRKSDRQVESALRYQDRANDIGEIPGPRSALRLKLDKYIHEIGSDVVGLEQNIKRITQETFYACETFDEEQALQKIWVNQPKRLYKGFPLVEEIGFVSVTNQVKPDGDCYWRALAFALHGKPARWDIVKADHLAYMQHVLGDKTHPRHQFYIELNTQFFETNAGRWKDGYASTTSRFKANIWQLLHLPRSWTPGVMQQITADLYNIHLITFTYDRTKNLCSEVSIRGAYNRRHVFMLFKDGTHFQPLTVNEYLS